MRKLLTVLFLVVVVALSAQEYAITSSGKKVKLNEDSTWSYVDNNKQDEFDFRKSYWGMSKEEVEASETLEKVDSSNPKNLMYLGRVAGMNCYVIYFFTNNVLTTGRYYFIEEHTNDNDFLSDFNNMSELLVKKYGEPSEAESYWKDDLYKDDYSSWGFAVSLGDYVRYSEWKSDKTEVYMELSGENYSISHFIDYTSIDLKDMKESAMTQDALNDL